MVMESVIRYLTVKEISEILHLHENSVFKMLNSGKLKGVKVGREWRMLESDLPKPEKK